MAKDVNKDLAKQIALGVDGIKTVDNKIEVGPNYTARAKPAERTYGERVDDASITAAVKSKLLGSRYADGLMADVETMRGKVRLSGYASRPPSRSGRSRPARRAHRSGVRGVFFAGHPYGAAPMPATAQSTLGSYTSPGIART